MGREQGQLVPTIVRGGIAPSLHLAVILPGVNRVVPPLSAAARMGGLVGGRVGGRAGAADRGCEPTPVEGLLFRSGLAS
jgi:hypothetical protein